MSISTLNGYRPVVFAGKNQDYAAAQVLAALKLAERPLSRADLVRVTGFDLRLDKALRVLDTLGWVTPQPDPHQNNIRQYALTTSGSQQSVAPLDLHGFLRLSNRRYNCGVPPWRLWPRDSQDEVNDRIVQLLTEQEKPMYPTELRNWLAAEFGINPRQTNLGIRQLLAEDKITEVTEFSPGGKQKLYSLKIATSTPKSLLST